MNIAQAIIEAINKGLEAWKVYVSTRQEAYERKMDKKKQKAIDIAEIAFERMEDLFYFIRDKNLLQDDKEYLKKKEEILKYKDKFNRYD